MTVVWSRRLEVVNGVSGSGVCHKRAFLSKLVNETALEARGLPWVRELVRRVYVSTAAVT